MIQTIITYINNRIDTLDMFNSLLGLCEIIEKRDDQTNISFPAQYCDSGEYKRVEDYDFVKGVVYHRLNGQVNEDTVESTVGCETNIRRRYPLRTVAVIRKDSLKNKNDNNAIDDKIASNLSNVIGNSSVKSLQTALSAEDVNIDTGNYNTNRYDIWNQEHRNILMSIDFDYVYLAIEYTVTVEGSRSCFDIYSCDTEVTLDDLCGVITEIDGGDSTSDAQFAEINGLLDGCSS
jgi:hypothetical protein